MLNIFDDIVSNDDIMLNIFDDMVSNDDIMLNIFDDMVCYVWCIWPFPDISGCCHYLSYATFSASHQKTKMRQETKNMTLSLSSLKIANMLKIA